MTNEELAELERQIERLAQFIMHKIPGEPSQSEGAVDTAIRIMDVQAREAEALRAENARLRRDRADLLTFAKAIQIWRSDADSYDRECGHPQRNYCEDVELMEGCADVVVRRVAALEQGEVK